MYQALSNGSRSFRRRDGVAARRGIPRAVPAAGPPGPPSALVPRVHLRGRPAPSPPRGSGLVAEAGAAGLPRLMRLDGLLSGLV